MVTRYLQLGVLLFEGGFVVGQNSLLRHGSPTAISLLYSRLVYSLQHDKPVLEMHKAAVMRTGQPVPQVFQLLLHITAHHADFVERVPFSESCHWLMASDRSKGCAVCRECCQQYLALKLFFT